MINIKSGKAPWYNSGVSLNPSYIVVHYTANNGDTANGNCNYFANNKVKTGAHYFVDENEVRISTPITRLANHCGGKLQGSGGHTFYGKAKNSNSIGVEMCSRKDANGNYYFKDGTLNNCAELVKYLMQKYNIPIDRVIRHYDVTGKICPAPLVNETQWINFKKKLNGVTVSQTTEVVKNDGYIIEVTASELNLREKPNANSKIIQVLKKGDRVKIVGYSGKWLETNWHYWIHGNYTKVVR